MREGDDEQRGFDDPICVRGREIVADHYRFTRFHDRPSGGPRVTLGFVMGHLDAYTGGAGKQAHVWCVDDPAFAAGAPEATWAHFGGMFESEPWYVPPRKYYWQADATKPRWHGTPPCGQIDIVPIEAPPEVLKKYGCLVFLGWNTMTPEHYEKLKAYVRGGGRLVMSVPHLSTQLRRDRVPEIINDGDISDLFGVRVLGKGSDIDEVQLFEGSAHKAYELPVGALYLEEATLAKLELRGARVLARPRRSEDPVLVEHRLGKGVAWLLATWDYPGQRLDAFITDLLRTVAEGEQGDIALRGEGVAYAIYDGPHPRNLKTIYLANKSLYGQPHIPTLVVRGREIPLYVGGRDMRVAWLCGDLLMSPLDRYVKVTGAEQTARGYRIDLAAEPGVHRIDLAPVRGAIKVVKIDGRTQKLRADADGLATFTCKLRETARLEVAVTR
jgi:hypothetical protein